MNEIMMEVRGLAEGLHQKYEDLAYWLFNIYCNEEEYGCYDLTRKINYNLGVREYGNVECLERL